MNNNLANQVRFWESGPGHDMADCLFVPGATEAHSISLDPHAFQGVGAIKQIFQQIEGFKSSKPRQTEDPFLSTRDDQSSSDYLVFGALNGLLFMAPGQSVGQRRPLPPLAQKSFDPEVEVISREAAADDPSGANMGRAAGEFLDLLAACRRSRGE